MPVLTMPTSPAFTRSRFGLKSNTQKFQSPLTGSTQTLELAGARWRARYELPPMKRDQAAAWQAFLLQLRGQNGQFYGHDPDAVNPRGVASTTIGTTNYHPNGQHSGAVAGIIGSGGAFPTSGWFIGPAAGLTTEILASGNRDGFSYVRVRIYGTTSGTSYALSNLPSTGISTVQGEVWTSSMYLAMVAGSMANISLIRCRTVERDSGGAVLAATNVSYPTLTGSFQRQSATRTMAGATAARVTSGLEMSITNGAAVDITLELAASQLEKLNAVTPYLNTTGIARSRPAGVSVNGGGQTGTALSLMGLTQNTAGILKAADYLQYDTAYGRQLHMIMADVASSEFGTTVVTVEPPIRFSPDDGSPVTLVKASCAMSLTSDDDMWEVDKIGVYGISFEAEERLA